MRISVLLLAENALLNHSGEASDNLIIFMGTLHRGNGANNDTFNKVGGVSQWQNSPIKKHRIYYDIIFYLQYMAIWCQILSSPTALLYIYIAIEMGARLGCICLYKILIRSCALFLSGSSSETRSQQQRCKLPAFDAG